MARSSGRFRFDGGAATYAGTALLAVLVTVGTAGICYPFALVLRERWRAKHTYVDGQRLVFRGSALGLFGRWLLWLLLLVVTLGVYGFWIGPRLQRWKTEHTDFDPSWRPEGLTIASALAPYVSGKHLDTPGSASLEV